MERFQQKRFWVYITTNKSNQVLYTGMTNNIQRRHFEHKSKKSAKSFTARYNCNKLVYYKEYSNAVQAIAREKQIKAGSRRKKIQLIESQNPEWKDLSLEWEY